jgi:hypothetical protein
MCSLKEMASIIDRSVRFVSAATTTRPKDTGLPKAPQSQLKTEFGFFIHENIYFLPCAEPPSEEGPNHYFSIEDQYVYCPFARDFGPFNLGVVLRFCELMEEKRAEFPSRKIILHCPMEPEKCTNVAFLLGSFLVSSPFQIRDACYRADTLIDE